MNHRLLRVPAGSERLVAFDASYDTPRITLYLSHPLNG